MSQINQEVQKLDTDEFVSLFTLDATSIGGPILRFSKGAAVTFGGLVYPPADFEFNGLETSGVGAFPTPKFKIANSSDAIQAVVNTWGDLNGCTLSRVRTYKRFLDGEQDADPSAFFGPDIYRVDRMVDDNAQSIEWEMSTAIDQEGKMLPGRVIIAGTCMWRYRAWDKDMNAGAGAFDYSKAQCPYAGTQSFDINNQPVSDEQDKPSRTLSCCRTRFGADQPLPFGGFPGAPRL